MTSRKEFTLRAENLSVGYDSSIALQISNLELTGGIVALAGHNGAGKSTFIKALLGLLPTRTGHISAYNPHTEEKLIAEKHMAFCPETGSVFSDISVIEYIRLWCRLKCKDPNYFKKEGKELLEALELEPLLKKKGRELSKGQKQRVQIAAGFYSKPHLFLFDEPFDGLDVQRTHELMQIMRRYSPETSYIVSSHRMDVVERLADRVIVLQDGAVKTYGATLKVSQELCGKMYLINNASSPEQLRDELQQAFPRAFVYLTGQSVRFITRQTPKEKLSKALHQIDRNGAQMSEMTPTLTDAMSFHLKQLAIRN